MGIVADRLREAMDLRQIKQADLSRITGIGKSSISTYLSGEYEPKQINTYKLAQALNVNPSWLLGNDIPMDLPSAESTSLPQNQQIDVIHISYASGNQSSDELRKQLHEFIDSLPDDELRAMSIVFKIPFR